MNNSFIEGKKNKGAALSDKEREGGKGLYVSDLFSKENFRAPWGEKEGGCRGVF